MKEMKKEYGINGHHSALGRQLDDAEFKGYVVAKLEELTQLREEFKKMSDSHDELDNKRFDELGKRIGSLQTFRANLNGRIAIVSAVVGVLIAVAVHFIVSG